MALPDHNSSVRLVQITDCHLYGDPESTLVGMNCNDSLDAVLDLVREDESGIDAFVCTGDLVQDGSEAGYRALRHKLEQFGLPYHWLCGNHDERVQMARVLADRPRAFCGQALYGNWQVLFLDSQVPGKIYGHLERGELDRLRAYLEQAAQAGLFSLVCLHHNPVPVQAAWLQRHSLKNPDELFDVLAEYAGVKGVLNGHIHQQQESRIRGVPVWAAPSTCVQFHPVYDEFTVDELNPGYRWLELKPDGSIATGVKRVTGRTFSADPDSAGY